MKKFVKISCITGGIVTGTMLLLGVGYDLLGFAFKSLKDHGYVKRKKGEPRPKIASTQYVNDIFQMANDMFEDVEIGWTFIREGK